MNGKSKFLALTVILSVYFLCSFFKVSATIVIPVFKESFGMSASAAGIVSGMFFIPYAAMQLLAGPICKKFGPVKTLSVCMLICSAGTLSFAFAQNSAYVLFGRFIMGLCMGPVFISVLFFLQENFTLQQYAKMSGLSIMISNFGAVCSSAPLQFLLGKLGMKNLFLLLTGLLVFLFAILAVISRKSGFRAELNKGQSVVRQIADSAKYLFSDKQLVAGLLLFMTVNALLNAYQGLWCTSWTVQAFPDTTGKAAFSAAITGIGVMIGCLFSDSLRKKNNSRIKTVLNICLLNILLFAGLFMYRRFGTSLYVALGTDFAAGVITGHVCVQITALVRDRSDRERNSTVMGIINGVSSLASQIFQWISGVFIDVFIITSSANSAYTKAFILLEIPFIVSLIWSALANRKHMQTNR